MYVKYIPAKFGVLYTQAKDLPTVTAPGGPSELVPGPLTPWFNIPCYTTGWAEVELTCSGFLTVSLSTDFDQALAYNRIYTLAPGKNTIYYLVRGIPLYVSTTQGAHNFMGAVQTVTGTDPVTCSGRVILHGLRGA